MFKEGCSDIYEIKGFKDPKDINKAEFPVDKFYLEIDSLKEETKEKKSFTPEEINKKIAEAHDLVELIENKAEYTKYNATLSALANEMLKSSDKSKIESANA